MQVHITESCGATNAKTVAFRICHEGGLEARGMFFSRLKRKTLGSGFFRQQVLNWPQKERAHTVEEG